ncbi:TRAP transporter large permease [Pelagicoccus sp. NFK12]|uniref:TRAP transporter large permease n=1 Tax=Pelagicoccus enzymogenes TaxID=2773457 RepID=A0A927IIJ8_9BACT|nr:TRAP transporter large permease [Pelagicoccus enzymogenes]MBD5780570.1 TRAP transporter large permease [Pelagicoccus enzymogenes]MDQ8199029.1 TRAP transporter large permease [Pelagicoccus enzymogenes]
MVEVILILVSVFTVLLVMNVPIAVAIALASMLAMLADGHDPSLMVASKMANGIDSFALLAIPFFILSGLLMGKGGMARRLMDFAAALMGRFPGGLGYVNTFTCMLFGSISGSAAAAVTSIGGFMLPEMKQKGYNNEFSVSITTTAATTGLLIPPSNIMIVYAVASGSVSIAAMFMAGLLPGILIGLLLMVVCYIVATKNKLKPGERSSFNEILVSFKRAILSMLLLVIVIGGILGGIFTATEASAIAVAYSFLLSVVVYREVKLADLPDILLQSGVTTAVIMLLIGASAGMSWIMTIANIPQTVSAALLGISENPLVIMLMINLLLLFVGTFMDMTPAVLIFTPIFLPIARQLGIDDVQFGIIMIANLCIGLCTPPVGTCLFLGCGVGKTTIAKVTPYMIPFFIAMFIGLMLITYVSQLSMWLPNLLDL